MSLEIFDMKKLKRSPQRFSWFKGEAGTAERMTSLLAKLLCFAQVEILKKMQATPIRQTLPFTLGSRLEAAVKSVARSRVGGVYAPALDTFTIRHVSSGSNGNFPTQTGRNDAKFKIHAESKE